MGSARRVPGILVKDRWFRPGVLAKGLCMGIADVIPGVSGGTMALVLGIYRELVQSLSSLHLRWILPLVRWVSSGFRREERFRLAEALRSMNLVFLGWLGAGILAAIAAGSLVIPPLMGDYPVVIRGLFFGLILASVGVPFRMIRGRTVRLARVLLAGVPALLGGYLLSAPGSVYLVEPEWTGLRSRGERLGDVLARGPSSQPSHRVYWSPENAALRRYVERRHPERARRFRRRRAMRGGGGTAVSKQTLRARSDPYDRLRLDAGVTVRVPRLPLWYVFAAATVAISAMVLPGISGSYVLLILGTYFFVLNAARAVLHGLGGRGPPGYALLVLMVFGVGAGLGIVAVARLIGYLLSRWTDLTVGGLVGLMVGCLRGVWPFRRTVDGSPVNVLPTTFGPQAGLAVGSLFAGFLIVFAFTRFSGGPSDADDPRAG